jgi:predicted dehydrogenase
MLHIGIIGTGLIAREHAQAIAMLGRSVKLVAVADIASDRLQGFCEEFDVSRWYANGAELIADPEVDLVVVATPPSLHEEAVVAALKAGKYVLCEKPLAQSLESAERMAAAEERYPGRLSVNFQLRCTPLVRRMLWLIENGWIGTIESATVERHGYIPHSAAGNGSWWGRWGIAGGGVLMTQMIHELDILLLALGQPHSVSAKMDTRFTPIESEDWIDGTIQFDKGVKARFAASVNSGQMRGKLVINGSLGSISPGKLTLNDPNCEASAIAAVNRALPDTKPASMSLPNRAMRKLARKLGRSNKPEITPHALLYRAIAESVASSKPMPIPASEGMKTLQLCTGAYESAIAGKEIVLPLDTQAEAYGGVTKESYASRVPAKMIEFPAVPVLPKTNYVRIGLIGLDTTHVTTFADLLHNPFNDDHIPGAKIVAAFPGGSPDMAVSWERVDGFTKELHEKYGVPILDTPEAVADASDVVFILSCDGRTHPGLFRSVAGRGRPVFIDKPLAVSLADAIQIYDLAARTNTKFFASSAFRWSDGLVAAVNSIRASGENVKACTARYWGQIQPTQGRFFWYGIHAADMLLAVMGNGAANVESRTEGAKDYIEIEHKDGRRSTLIGDHYDGTFALSIETNKRTLEVPAGGAISARALAAALDVLTPGGYPRLWRASDAGSVSGRPGNTVDPSPAETLDVIALLDAAERSYASKQMIAL